MSEYPRFSNVRVTVLDGGGCGEAINRRAQYPKDVGANSLLHASQREAIDAPALASIGFQFTPGLEGIDMVGTRGKGEVRGGFGAAIPDHIGNGSPEGHQALMGYKVDREYLYFDQTGFPPEVVNLVRSTIEDVVGREVVIVRYPETDDVNGVKFINFPGIGDAHLASGKGKEPLVVPMYASSDSLIQIALHQGVVPQPLIEEIGKAVREAVNEKRLRIGRIIMRPFGGGPTPGSFERVSKDRRDYGVDPDGLTLIDYLTEAGIAVGGVGKAASMLNYHGFPDMGNIEKLGTDKERIGAIVRNFSERGRGRRFSFDNLVETDELWGHPRKPVEYSRHIAMIDTYIAKGLETMTEDDLWIITADHGNDPTWGRHNNHTNEQVLILVCSPRIRRSVDLGIRSSFADVAVTVAENYGMGDKIPGGKSFLGELLRRR